MVELYAGVEGTAAGIIDLWLSHFIGIGIDMDVVAAMIVGEQWMQHPAAPRWISQGRYLLRTAKSYLLSAKLLRFAICDAVSWLRFSRNFRV